MVKPPDLVVMSWEFIWLMIWVVFRRRIRKLYDLAFRRILMMSSVEESGVSPTTGDWGAAGTSGFAGAGAGEAGPGFAGGFGDAGARAGEGES